MTCAEKVSNAYNGTRRSMISNKKEMTEQVFCFPIQTGSIQHFLTIIFLQIINILKYK